MLRVYFSCSLSLLLTSCRISILIFTLPVSLQSSLTSFLQIICNVLHHSFDCGLYVTLHRVQVNQSMSLIRLPSLIYQSLQFLIQSHILFSLSIAPLHTFFCSVSITHIYTQCRHKYTETHVLFHTVIKYIH